ncbi:MAG: SpoIIE family protein phosphatase [Bacteroidales bacterium]|nr:SpoIIE family protein phosphatase [Bacteroidales bacterium]
MSENASIKRLKLTTFKLRSLLNITRAINENLTQDELLNRYETILRDDLNIGKLVLYKKDEQWKCILSAGVTDNALQEIDVEKYLMCFDEIQFVTASEEEILSNFDIIIPVIHNGKHISFVLIGDIDEEGEGVSPVIKHLNFIQTISNIIIVAIENIRLFKESLRQEAIRKELELASKMQNMLIPHTSSLPNNERVRMKAFYHPHLEVGGDYYDYLELNENEFGFCISDVSGKGMSAALLMSNFQANLRALFTDEISLEALIGKLNERVLHSTNGEKFITLFVGKYNFLTRELEYINAGHNQPILYSMNTKELTMLDMGCVGIGMLDEIPIFNRGTVHIDGPVKILCYTDGLVELMDGRGITAETAELEKCLKNSDNIENNINDIIKMQRVMEDSASIFDDISILGIELL